MRNITSTGKIKKTSVAAGFKYVFLTLYAITTLFPFFWIILSSLKKTSEIYASPFSLPKEWMFGNYVVAWKDAAIGINFFNSAIYSFSSVFLVLLIGSMVSYILAKVRPNLLLYTYFTLGIMIPVHTILIPTFILLKKMGINNSRVGIIIIYTVMNLSLAVFIITGFMKTLPTAIQEAAYIDGCSRTRTFFMIILPLSKPGLATVGTLAFLNSWNDYLFAMVIVAGNSSLKTMTQGIFDLQGSYWSDYGPLCAGLALLVIPVMVMYVLFQEQIIKGFASGALKG